MSGASISSSAKNDGNIQSVYRQREKGQADKLPGPARTIQLGVSHLLLLFRVGIQRCRNCIYDCGRKICDSIVDLLVNLGHYSMFGRVSKSNSTNQLRPR